LALVAVFGTGVLGVATVESIVVQTHLEVVAVVCVIGWSLIIDVDGFGAGAAVVDTAVVDTAVVGSGMGSNGGGWLIVLLLLLLLFRLSVEGFLVWSGCITVSVLCVLSPCGSCGSWVVTLFP